MRKKFGLFMLDVSSAVVLGLGIIVASFPTALYLGAGVHGVVM